MNRFYLDIETGPKLASEKHKHTKNDKEKGTGITKYTCTEKIDEGHSIERVWHSSASRDKEHYLLLLIRGTRRETVYSTKQRKE